MDYKTGCLICGQALVYLQQNETHACYYCGESHETNTLCVQGHFVCDDCHSLTANDLIEQYCLHSNQVDPMEMAITLMKNPVVKMHGPEHHFLVPAVLLAAFYNQGGSGEKEKKIKQAWQRAENVKGGFCGFYGDCGAAVGTGIFMSLMTGATPLSRNEWKLSNLMTAKSLLEIAEHGGPRCCKRNTYLAIITAGAFLKEHFNTSFAMNEKVQCEFTAYNKECLLVDCPFYKGN